MRGERQYDTGIIHKIQQFIDESVDDNGCTHEDDSDIELCMRLLARSPAANESLEAISVKTSASQPDVVSLVSADDVDGVLLENWSEGRFECERLLGAGGFGIVFAARDLLRCTRIALKLLRPSLASSIGLRRRFLREALTVQDLQCDQIVKPLHIGLLQGIPAIVTELIEGPNLRQYLDSQGGVLPERQAITLVFEIAKTIQFMHERGVLHRDLKPANILLRTTSVAASGDIPFEPMIVDFGLAKHVDSKTLTSITGVQGRSVLGTLQYMAPEQVSNEREQVSTQSDLYALAAILYECLVGVVPNRGDSYVEILASMLHFDPLPVRRIKPALSRDIEQVLNCALSRDLTQRYSSVADFGKDLQAILHGRPIDANRRSIATLIGTWAKRNPGLATLSCSFIGLLLISCATFGVLYYRERRAVDSFKDLMEKTLKSVRLHVELAEDLLANVPASADQRYELHKNALEALQSIADGLNHNRESIYRLSVQYSYLSTAAAQAHRAEESIEMRRECLKLIDYLLVEEPENETYLYDQFYNRKSLVDHLANRPLPEHIKLVESNLPLIRRLIAKVPTNPDYRDAEASLLFSIGLDKLNGDLEGAEKELTAAVEISDSLFREYPHKLLHAKYGIVGRAALGDLARKNGQPVLAEKWCREGIRHVETVEHPSKDDFWFLYIVREVYRSYAATLVYQQRWSDCVPALEKCIEIEERLDVFDPKNQIYAIGKAEYMGELLRARVKLGDSPDEVSELRRKLEGQIARWESLDTQLEALEELRAIIADPDAPPIEAGQCRPNPRQVEKN